MMKSRWPGGMESSSGEGVLEDGKLSSQAHRRLYLLA